MQSYSARGAITTTSSVLVPASDRDRVLKRMRIYNDDSATITITVSFDDGLNVLPVEVRTVEADGMAEWDFGTDGFPLKPGQSFTYALAAAATTGPTSLSWWQE